MIDLYYSATRGQYGIMMLLEEAGLRYQLIPVDIAIENQIRLPGVTVPADSRIPALVDHRPKIVHAPGAVFASCAVLFYLADKTARFIPPRQSRIGELQWIVSRTGAVTRPRVGRCRRYARRATSCNVVRGFAGPCVLNLLPCQSNLAHGTNYFHILSRGK